MSLRGQSPSLSFARHDNADRGGTAGTYAGLDRFDRVIDQRWTDAGSNALARLEYQSREYNDLNQIKKLKRPDDQPFWANPRFDWAGNMTRIPKDGDPGRALRVDYDAWNRPVQVYCYDEDWTRKKLASYRYDGRHYRIVEQQYDPEASKTGAFTRRLDHYYDEAWRLIESYQTNADVVAPLTAGELAERFVWNRATGAYPDSLILRERALGTGIDDERLYACQDAHENVVAIVDPAGSVTERLSYSAFGSPQWWSADYTPRAVSSFAWNVAFSGYRLDAATGLYQVRYRSYAPVIGRWPSRDPIGERGGLNLYGFVENDAINKWDLLGQQSQECCKKKLKGSNSRVYCCCKGKRVRKKPVATGAQWCTVNDSGYRHRYGVPFHRYIVAPNGKTIGGAGLKGVQSPDNWGDPDAPNQSCNPIKRSRCSVDIEKFKTCLNRIANDGGCSDVTGFTCIGLALSVLSRCADEAKLDCD